MIRAFLDLQARRLRRLLSPAARRAGRFADGEIETALEAVYRLLLARPLDDGGRAHYLRLLRNRRMTLGEVAAEIAVSPEFHDRIKRRVAKLNGRAASASPSPAGFVDVSQLIGAADVSDLVRSAENYYAKTVGSVERYHARPLADIHEAPDLLGAFAQLLGGLRLAPAMKVLDFGAGTCWTTRFLAQMGCEVTALDVSPTALQVGKELFRRLPPVGDTPMPRFLVFDGRRIDLPSASVDRIVSFDAFHHVPNPREVVAELGRLLRPGGIAGFSEPGPHHSRSAKAQFEMKNFGVVENDLVMTDIWRWAREAGFTDIELSIFSTESCRVSLQDFEDLLAGGPQMDAYGDRLRGFLTGHQTFFLVKGEPARPDSRQRQGLNGEVSVTIERTTVGACEPFRGHAVVRNPGPAVWLAGATVVGGVNVGVHLRTRAGAPVDVNFGRVRLEDAVEPGSERTVDFSLPPPPPGEYLLEFDLVSENVGWFEVSGSRTSTVAVSVRAE